MTKTFYRFELEGKQVKLITLKGTPTVNGYYVHRKFLSVERKIYVPDKEFDKKYAWPSLEEALDKFKKQMQGKQKIADNIIHIAKMNTNEAVRLYENAKQEMIT